MFRGSVVFRRTLRPLLFTELSSIGRNQHVDFKYRHSARQRAIFASCLFPRGQRREIVDARRFASAPRTMAFVGLVPSEHSSGTRQARGAITKTGNAHLRRVLVEAAWHYRHRPFVGGALRRRQQGAPDTIIAQAWTAQQRLYRRYHRLAARGKPSPHIITAVARELTGFVWAALTQ